MEKEFLSHLEEIQEVYIIPADFFKPEGFIERCKRELAIFRAKIRTEEKEKIRTQINAFQVACLHAPLAEDVKIGVALMFLDTLNHYAQQYRSKETYLNIFKSFEKPDFKEKLFAGFPVKAKLVYAESLLGYYMLVKNEEPHFSFGKTAHLIKAKSLLWKVYIHHIEKKNTLTKVDLSHCLSMLSLALAELSRWFEPLFYLNEAKAQLPNNPNIEYSRALILDAVKQKTCLSFNGQLILKIIDSCLEASRFPQILKQQKDQLKEMERECRVFLSEHKLPIQKLRKHKTKVTKSFNKYNPYRKYCAVNQLFLNEHSFFCNCGHSTRDNLQIVTGHDHTKIGWVKQFEKLIDSFAFEFIVARHNFYFSLPGVSVSSFQIRQVKREQPEQNIKNALLKNAFKTLYSLLDQIAQAIFKVLEIDVDKMLREKFPNDNERPKIYFLNMWDLGLFNDKRFADNFYLVSLYSIAQDLTNSKYAALKGFRVIRNAMEHKTLHITLQSKDKLGLSDSDIVYTKEELLEKTKILMLLTKSAIYSFVYLVRKQSKIKHKESSKSAADADAKGAENIVQKFKQGDGPSVLP